MCELWKHTRGACSQHEYGIQTNQMMKTNEKWKRAWAWNEQIRMYNEASPSTTTHIALPFKSSHQQHCVTCDGHTQTYTNTNRKGCLANGTMAKQTESYCLCSAMLLMHSSVVLLFPFVVAICCVLLCFVTRKWSCVCVCVRAAYHARSDGAFSSIVDAMPNGELNKLKQDLRGFVVLFCYSAI